MVAFSQLDGQRVVVIGASSGIGLALSRSCANYGAHVVMASRSMERLELARASIDGSTEIQAVDMLNELAIENFFKEVGKFDHLVVTAVADETKLKSPVMEMSTEVARQSFQKFWGSFFAVRASAPYVSKSGSITLTSSVAIFAPSRNGGYTVAHAASAAVAAFGRSLVAELKPVRVNVLAPGVVESGVWNEKEKEGLREWAESTLPVQHLGKPDELSNAVLFLMTNPYVTGVVLPVDGGMLLS